jgi:hypothetical protein
MARIANIGAFNGVGIIGQASLSGTSTLPDYSNGNVETGRIQFVQPRPNRQEPVRVTCWLDGPPIPTGAGYGGWTVVSRDGQEGFVEFDGPDPERWSVPVLLNGWSDYIDQAPMWDDLWSMAKMRGGKPPGPVRVYGILPERLTSSEWVIEAILPGDQEKFLFDDGTRDKKEREKESRRYMLLRAAAVVTLVAPDEPKLVTDPIKRAQKHASGHGKPHTVTVKKRDTLLTIAARVYGNPARWRDIAAANPKAVPYGDPEAVKPGTVLKLPD